MIVTLNITVGKNRWGDNDVWKRVEVHTENFASGVLPWEAICAGLIQSALTEYAQAKDATSILEWRAIESPSNDFDSKFAIWRYVFCASGEHDAENQIRTEFENRYGHQPVVARKVCPTGKTWLVGPVETRITGGRTE